MVQNVKLSLWIKYKKKCCFLIFLKKCSNDNKIFSYKLCYIVTLAFLTFRNYLNTKIIKIKIL